MEENKFLDLKVSELDRKTLEDELKLHLTRREEFIKLEEQLETAEEIIHKYVNCYGYIDMGLTDKAVKFLKEMGYEQ